MKILSSEGTRRTPTMYFDEAEGLFKITGRSIPENTFKFYQPYIDWIHQYLKTTKNPTTRLHINLEYCNSSSGRFLLDIFKLMDASASAKHQVYIEWHYADNDDDMMEIGQDLASFLKNAQTELISYRRDHPIF